MNAAPTGFFVMILLPPDMPVPLREQPLSHPVFAEFSTDELNSLIAHLFAILPQRGCEQRCAGCHASAIPQVAGADWERTVTVIDALAHASQVTGTRVGSAFPGALVETFRDSDPAHVRFTNTDGVKRGIGDFAALIHERLGQQVKIMTSGVRAQVENGALRINLTDLAQLERAAAYAGSLSVSASIETIQHRAMGVDDNAAILAATLEAMVRGSLKNLHTPRIFLDVMFFSPDGDDPHTRRTLELYTAVIRHLGMDTLSAAARDELLSLFDQSIDGTRNQRYAVPDASFGVRSSPHLNIGRAAITGRGQELSQAAPSDWLSVLKGDPRDALVIDGERYTRHELTHDLVRRHQLIEQMQHERGGGFLAEHVKIKGDPLRFFRTEIDLTDAQPLKLAGRAASPGINLPPSVNLLISDPAGDELQVVIPYKRLHV